MDNLQTGAFIRELRKEKTLTQRELAEQLHITDRAVSKWERGLCAPDLATLEPLAEILGVTVAELIAGKRMEETPHKSEIVENENNETLQKVAEYAVEEKRIQGKKRKKALLAMLILVLTSDLLFSGETKGGS